MNPFFEHFDRHKYIYMIAVAYASLAYIIAPLNPLIGDAATYADLAKNIATQGKLYANFAPSADEPFFSIVFAFFMKMFENNFIELYIAFASLSFIISSYFISFEIFGKESQKKSIYVIFVLLSLTLIIYHTLQPLTDILFLTLLNISSIFYMKFLKTEKTHNLFLSGIFIGLLSLTRMIGIIFFGILTVHQLIISNGFQKNAKTAIKNCAILFLTAFLVLSPWLARNYSMELDNDLTRNLSSLPHITDSNSDAVPKIAISLKDGRSPDIAFSISVPIQIEHFFRMVILLLIFIMPAMIFVISSEFWRSISNLDKSRKHAETTFLLIWISIFVFFHILMPAGLVSRFLLPLVVPSSILFVKYCSENFDTRRILVIALIVLHAISAAGIFYWDHSTRWDRIDTNVFVEAGNWIKDNTESNDAILVHGAQAGTMTYYGERKIYEEYQDPEYIILSDIEKTQKPIPNTSQYSVCFSKEDRYNVEIYGKKC